MSKRSYNTSHRPASTKVKYVRDPLLESSNRPIINDGKLQYLPQALAFSQVDYIVSMRVTDCEWVAEGSIKANCLNCNLPCWRSPSSPKRLPLLCVPCCVERIKKEKTN